MNSSVLCFLVFAVLAVPQAFAAEQQTNHWGAPTNGLQMSISVRERKIDNQANPMVNLVFRIRNISTNLTFIFYRAHSAELSPYLSFQVTAPFGKDISPKSRRPYRGSGLDYKLTPRMQVQFEAELSFLCSFAKKGSYEVTASWDIGSLTTHKVTTVVSNPLFIVVGKNELTQGR